MKKITVWPGQTIYDIVLKHYGSLLGLQYLLEDNPGILIPSVEGMELKIRKNTFIDRSVVDYFSNRQIATY